MYVSCVPGVCRVQKRVLDFPELELKFVSCHMSVGNNLGLLQGWQVLLIAEPSLQPQRLIFSVILGYTECQGLLWLVTCISPPPSNFMLESIFHVEKFDAYDEHCINQIRLGMYLHW